MPLIFEKGFFFKLGSRREKSRQVARVLQHIFYSTIRGRAATVSMAKEFAKRRQGALGEEGGSMPFVRFCFPLFNRDSLYTTGIPPKWIRQFPQPLLHLGVNAALRAIYGGIESVSDVYILGIYVKKRKSPFFRRY